MRGRFGAALSAWAVALFDRLERRWHSPRAKRWVGSLIVGSFLVGLLVIELNRQGLVPDAFADALPTNHFHAVALAFSLLLLFEVIDLVFSLAASVANALGKQFEVFSLILLRQSFKELTAFGEPVSWDQVRASVGPMLGDAVGALLLFVVLGFYYRVQHHQPISTNDEERRSFVAAKKLLALLLLVAFLAIGANDVLRLVAGERPYPFFQAFYTVMIFFDILVVLLSVRTASAFPVMFRNSGFAAATVILRLALTAPPYVNAALGLLAGLFACGLTLAYNSFERGEAEVIEAEVIEAEVIEAEVIESARGEA